MGIRAMCAGMTLALIVSGCGRRTGDSQGTGDSQIEHLSATETSLALRVTETQLANGYWDWQQLRPTPPVPPGYQSLIGVTADGVLSAYEIDQNDGHDNDVPELRASIDLAKDALIDLCDEFVNAAGDRPSISNFVFLGRYRNIVGLTPLEELTVRSALDLRLSQDNDSHGTDPSVVVDGWLNLISETRASTPGIIGWDTAFIVKVLLLWTMPAAELDYAVDFLKGLPVDTSVEYGLYSAAHVLEVLNMGGVDDTSLNSTLIAGIEDRAMGDGSYVGEGADEGPGYQSTAYVLMAYKEIGAAQVDPIQQWLAAQVHPDGSIYDPVTQMETYEVEGEVLLALIK